ncbi:hypothetical protein SAMN05216406_13520 [Nitrosomonas ureae]|uniref:Uncharacterized protein n=2 Tax=Nitrosomonas ureae TaxID=44577 RepID=A0A1H2GQ63_9PROT|nr:hypothetical protein ATY38_07830 [Nitrosomonas ureae]SDU21651.1 hypothetical protein SAMN05216406_13520 [Nitrosomonas ureae]
MIRSHVGKPPVSQKIHFQIGDTPKHTISFYRSICYTIILGKLPDTTDCKYRSSNIILLKLASAGIDDAIEEPTIEDYKQLLCNAVSNFSMLGVGADKITRDFDIFKETMNRCASNDKPARFLLVAPDVDWVNHGAIRRGLGDNHFSKILINSLRKIAELKCQNGMPIEVRFYRSTPLFRMIFVNDEECWFGYYSESVVNSGENEFVNKSHTNIIIRRPKNKPPDRELYGAIEAYYNTLWEKSTDEIWDFKKYLS